MGKSEVFLPLPGFSGYSISDQGRVLNNRTGRIRKQVLSNAGYLVVSFWNHGRPVLKTVHRLVAQAFLGPRAGMQVNHLNGVRTDNRSINLEWVTGSENMRHAAANGLVRFRRDPQTGRLAGSLASETPAPIPRHDRKVDAA